MTVHEHLLAANDHVAAHVREHLDANGVLAVNIMSSPGSGKTRLLEATIEALRPHARIAVIEGDLETENDADRIRRHGVRAVQITTGVTCHLDATMVHDALHAIPLKDVDLLFIENVGNLVCPADFDVGAHLSVVLLSVTEGDDKPEKYPVIFRGADMVLVSKTDLLAFITEFDVGLARACVGRLGGTRPLLEVSAKTGQGIGDWTDWVLKQLAARRATHPKHEHVPSHSHAVQEAI
ncbi:hydrogenase nickel incorporation protein HypB [Rhodovastum atsumiense]|uniref:hydrogenase nickel incorporation protein HypB n=1 Tax=Rhodovastum atsumiense TaxID=504468 RepID=UPI001EEFE1EF|nr:hydrogenase nickel incorporation protein HypB [Rhodovastum atsumiense]